MSNYLYRLARFAFRRRRLVLAAWLAAAIAAIAIAVASGGKTNDNFTIPGTEAQNAAQVLSERLPEVMIVDIGLPGMDGYELASRVRALPGGDRMMLVALTGYGGTHDKMLARAAGFDEHVTKPIEVVELDELIGRLRASTS